MPTVLVLDKAQSFVDAHPDKAYRMPGTRSSTIKAHHNATTASSNRQIVNNESLRAILECYAHVLCGPSLVCPDFCDMHDWLS